MFKNLLIGLACLCQTPMVLTLTINAPFDLDYNARDLGDLTLLASDPNTLLIGSNATSFAAGIFSPPPQIVRLPAPCLLLVGVFCLLITGRRRHRDPPAA